MHALQLIVSVQLAEATPTCARNLVRKSAGVHVPVKASACVFECSCALVGVNMRMSLGCVRVCGYAYVRAVGVCGHNQRV